MGNVSGREEKSNQESYSYMECGHGQVNSSSSNSNDGVHMLPTPHIPRASLSPMTMSPQIQRGEFNETSRQHRIPAVISWIHGGTQVAVAGSWDNWRTRELLEGSGSNFSILKVLNSGVYHYRFAVDGQWTHAPDLPHEHFDAGNILNILDLKDNYPENMDRDQEPDRPSSPISTYNNAVLTLEDFSEKLPELPPLLQQMPLNQPSSSKNCQRALHKPLSANLNHLYIKRDSSSQSVVALSSSQRFRNKFVTTVLYKPFKKVRK